MLFLQIALIIVATFVFMEFMAWFLHKYVMHGFLWVLHYDHHNKQPGFLEKNDTFFLVFAVPSSISIFTGLLWQVPIVYSIGFGILLYGIAYFLVHEVLIHKRLPKLRKVLFENLNNDYLNTLVYAHRMHHKHIGKEDGESFGMLVVDKSYFIEYKAKKAK
jgi:beta-carotene 3-hydroxylase